MGVMPEVAVLLSKAIASELLARIEQNGAGIALQKEVVLKKVFLWFCCCESCK